MSDRDAVVTSYIEMWNETDPQRRRKLVSEVVTADASYVDPLMSGDGINGIAAMTGGAQERYPGHRFALVTGPDSHHDRVRFSWSIAPDGESRSPSASTEMNANGKTIIPMPWAACALPANRPWR